MIPSDLASFVACHEARDHVGAIGTPVSQLIGKYGSPNGQVQATAGMRPTIQQTINGSYPCLRFDDLDDILVFNSATSLTGPYTIFHVYAGRGTGGGKHRTLSGEATFNGGWGDAWLLAWDGNVGGHYQANAYPGGGNEINSFTYIPDEIRIHCVKMGIPLSSNLRYSIANNSVGAASGATGPGTLQIGRAGTPAHCDWIATITFSEELDTINTEGIYNYIANQILGWDKQEFTQHVVEVVGSADPLINFSQFVIELVVKVSRTATVRVSGSGNVTAIGKVGCLCVRRIGGVCEHSTDVPETEIVGTPADWSPCETSFPIECT